ncbi:hypothetical protein HDV02_004666 [Globomyces sp. JEL0801]|nr:hypothetical protein HDV02_004666 [Globomyces sp. JEL0801]
MFNSIPVPVNCHPLLYCPTQTDTPSIPNRLVHLVDSNDSITSLAILYGVKPIDIKVANKLTTDDALHSRKNIVILHPTKLYTQPQQSQCSSPRPSIDSGYSSSTTFHTIQDIFEHCDRDIDYAINQFDIPEPTRSNNSHTTSPAFSHTSHTSTHVFTTPISSLGFDCFLMDSNIPRSPKHSSASPTLSSKGSHESLQARINPDPPSHRQPRISTDSTKICFNDSIPSKIQFKLQSAPVPVIATAPLRAADCEWVDLKNMRV